MANKRERLGAYADAKARQLLLQAFINPRKFFHEVRGMVLVTAEHAPHVDDDGVKALTDGINAEVAAGAKSKAELFIELWDKGDKVVEFLAENPVKKG
jgi:hypothetical protein